MKHDIIHFSLSICLRNMKCPVVSIFPVSTISKRFTGLLMLLRMLSNHQPHPSLRGLAYPQVESSSHQVWINDSPEYLCFNHKKKWLVMTSFLLLLKNVKGLEPGEQNGSGACVRNCDGKELHVALNHDVLVTRVSRHEKASIQHKFAAECASSGSRGNLTLSTL